MKRKLFLLTAIMVGMAVALAWGNPAKNRAGKFKELKLSDQQKMQLRELNFNTAKEMTQLKADLKIARLEYRQALTGETADKSQLFEKIDQMTKIKGEMGKLHTAKMLAVRDILTEEQLKKFKELKMDGRMKAGKKFQRHQGLKKGSFL